MSALEHLWKARSKDRDTPHVGEGASTPSVIGEPGDATQHFLFCEYPEAWRRIRTPAEIEHEPLRLPVLPRIALHHSSVTLEIARNSV
jgi:hypothetical protein